MLKFDKEGSPMWVWVFRLLIDEKLYEALIHGYSRESAIKRLNILVRKGEFHGRCVRDVREMQVEDDLYDSENPSHREYIRRVFA